MSALDASELAASRSATYWLLSELYLTQPDEAFRASLRGRLAAVAGAAREAGSAGVAALRRALETTSAESLAREHTRLFAGLGEGFGPPPPYESVHRESRAMGESTLAVTRAYADAGYATIEREAGPQDHLGVELRFLSLACHDESAAWRADDVEGALALLRRERDFLEAHLLAWAPAYCATIATASRESFYAELASLTGRVLADDRVLVRDLLAELAA